MFSEAITAKQLTATGIAVGATVTQDMLAAIGEMLAERDKHIADLSETVVHRTTQLTEIAHVLGAPREDGVAPRIDNLVEQIEAIWEAQLGAETSLSSLEGRLRQLQGDARPA